MPTYKKSQTVLRSKPVDTMLQIRASSLDNQILSESIPSESVPNKVADKENFDLAIENKDIKNTIKKNRIAENEKKKNLKSQPSQELTQETDVDKNELLGKLAKLSTSQKKSRQIFRISTVFFSIMLIVVFSLLINSRMALSDLEKRLSDSTVGGVSTRSKELGNLTPLVEDLKNTKYIVSFQDNPAIFDYGFKIDIQKSSISTLDDPNCKTPIVPPTINGCGFGLNLQNIGLPTEGLAFKNLVLETSNTDNKNKIQIDLKDYIKSELVKNISTIDSSIDSHRINLPSYIPSSQGLYFRFWTADKIVKINRISIEYYSIKDLKSVQVNIDTEKDPAINATKTASIYSDQNENDKFEEDIDLKWVCASNFPGVLPVPLSENQTLNLRRDDGCMTDQKPEEWDTDLALPPGKWLFVIDKDNYYKFEIKPEDSSKTLEIKI